MPYDVKKQGARFCVYKAGDDEPMKCYLRASEAYKYKAALDAAMEEGGEAAMAEFAAMVGEELAGRGLFPPIEGPWLPAEATVHFGDSDASTTEDLA